LFVFGVLFSMEGVAEYAEFDPGSPFIPLIGDVTGDMLLFNNSRDGDRGKLHIYSVSLLSIDEPYTYFDSINTMAETTIRAYKEGALSIDRRDGRLAVDTDRHRKIAAKMNPGSAFWKLK
ncbi:MAG: hypothetical protein Q8938_21285, partial [Bacteroidota bacterium]|nr:hypothetical protein [Bacteroidota bacterium]